MKKQKQTSDLEKQRFRERLNSLFSLYGIRSQKLAEMMGELPKKENNEVIITKRSLAPLRVNSDQSN